MAFRRNQDEGQSLVEFALFVPILALLLSGLAAFGFLLYAHVQVTNATREGARAGALYLGGRFKYTSATSGSNCWTLRDWVENAIVERTRDTGTTGPDAGCPITPAAYSTSTHALGLLNPTRCGSATSGSDCWWLEQLQVNGTEASTTSSSSQAEVDGETITSLIATNGDVPLRVQLIYRFNVPFFGSIFNTNPIVIRKIVIMRMQNN